MRINFEQCSPQFVAKPANAEMKLYTKTLSQGLKALDKEVGIIIHNSSVPSNPAENTGIGSLLSTTARAAFIPFLKDQSVTTILQEPNYLRRPSDPSPYSPMTTSKNIYMIPLEKLASDDYGNLISERTLKTIVNRAEASDRVNYDNIAIDYDFALWEAYSTFKRQTKDPHGSLRAIGLNLELKDFKKDHQEELEPHAIYEILAKEYHNDDWQYWNPVDKNLYDSDTPETKQRLKEIKETYKDEIDFYMFKQMLVEREIYLANKENSKNRIKIIADTPIAFTPAEQWLNKELFLDDLVLGCPPDFYSKEGQRWDFAVLNPKLIFNEDGTLGKGGKFLKQRYEEIFQDSPGGVRIDHLIGLIDPFVYSMKEPHMNSENSGRLYSSPEHKLLKQYVKHSDEEYSAIFEKIIFPAAAKYGITKDKIICEDLGDVTPPTKKVINNLQLTGLTLTQYGYSGADAPERNVILTGAHDNKSYIEYTEDLFNGASSLDGGRDRFMYKTHILGSDTVIPGQDVNSYREELRSNKLKFMAASFAELFTSPAKKVQVFFTDFFGIGKTYNVPGSKENCWTLRLDSDFERLYYDNLSKGLGLNLPQAIATAIRNKGKEFSAKYNDLLERLDYFTKVLKS